MKLVTRRPEVLTGQDMQKIYDAAIRVVRRVPLTCHATGEFYSYLRQFGCEIDGDQITFPTDVVDKAIARIEEQRASNQEAHQGPLKGQQEGWGPRGRGHSSCAAATARPL